MKVLQINAVYRYASTGRTCEELQKYINDNCGECLTIYGEHKGDFENTIYMGNVIDHKLHALFSRISGKVGYYSTLPTLKLFRFIKRYQPDVVHLRVLHSNFINIPMLLKFLGRYDIATVVTLHDCFMYTGKCCHYVDVICDKWQNQCSACPSYKEWNQTWFFDRTKKMFRDKYIGFENIKRLAIVGVSEWISSEAKKSIVLGSRNITTIYNWINLDVFKPRKNNIKARLGIQEKFMIFGVASDWSNKKGLCDFLELAEKLSNDYAVVLIGKLPNNIDLPKNIVSIPRTTDMVELSNYYSAADVFLQLSRQETFGKVTAEALACGTPIIVYNNTANAEMAVDGCGYCIDRTGDVDEVMKYINVIREAVDEPWEQRCRERAKKLFDYTSNCQKYIDLYRKLMNERGMF